MNVGSINVGIIGGAGYTGGELLRLLIRHPFVQLRFVHSQSNAGKYIYDVHTDLVGETVLQFSAEITTNIDVLFLCLGHGETQKFITENKIPPTVRIIDLSQDFRYPEPVNFTSHWIYGLPELQRNRIQEANKDGYNIANPGCFATCIQLGLLPLAQAGLLPHDIHTSAITGSTGAGQALSRTSHFSWRNNNVSTYKTLNHQHLYEIGRSLRQLQPSFDGTLHFIPYRGNFTRGILAVTYLSCDLSLEEVQNVYNQYYDNHPFTHQVFQNPDVKQVINTNKCLVYIEKHDTTLVVTTVIDNLLKGASGQAVQNMNLMFALDEKMGLLLKPLAY